MKSALVERELGNSVAERRMLDEGLKRYVRCSLDQHGVAWLGSKEPQDASGRQCYQYCGFSG